MSCPSHKVQQIAKRLASKEYVMQQQQFEQRCRDLSLWYKAAQTQFRAAQKECLWLEQVVCAKQYVIEVLLPYYPHPLTPDLKRAIELY